MKKYLNYWLRTPTVANLIYKTPNNMELGEKIRELFHKNENKTETQKIFFITID